MWGYEKPYMVDLKAVEVPSWVEQDFIRKNIFSRPDVTITRVNNIVIHYVANPGSTARSTRDYFELSLIQISSQALRLSAIFSIRLSVIFPILIPPPPAGC